MKKLLIMSAIASAMMLASCQQEAKLASGVNYDNLDTTVRPGDDFCQFSTGKWIDNNPQPAAYPRWGSFTKLGDDNVNQISSLIQEIAAEQHEYGTVAQKIGDLYNMAMDSTRRNELGAAPVLPYLAKIQAIKTREEFLKFIASEKDGVFFGIGIDADMKNSSMNIVGIGQGGLSMGNRDYYLNNDPKTTEIREAFKQHMVNLYKLCGVSEELATKKMQLIMKYETELAVPSYSRLQRRDPEANYHKMTIDELKAATNGFDWATFLVDYGYDQTTEVDLGQVAPVALGCKWLMTAPLEDLKTIYEWQTLNGAAGSLSDAFVEENFKYSQMLSGAKEMQPRWKRCVNLVNGSLGQPVGQLYVEKYFPAENKARMIELVKNLQTSLGERIKAQEWMSDATKAVALEKLASFYVKIGYPDTWDDYSSLDINPSLSLYDNQRAMWMFRWELDKQKNYNKPVNKNEWLMTPQTVNAYYNPTTNEICFPAGILQPPFFNMAADDAANYGAIGVVIGHEMTHGFDDQGRQFDKDGNLRQWWADEDVEAFKVPAEKLACYFDSLEVLPGEYANGHQCLGENLADHGGLNIAYEALQIAMQKQPLDIDNGYTPEQRFFLAYANVWAGVNTPEGIRYLNTNDVHAQSFHRINGALPHIDAWYEAFDVQPGDKLYLAPEDRVRIW
ncbi:MAG: M13 family metallopeptidase [Bacteroidales bacterium]|nr:M13 family metallopeptidase [Candidatus Liminaster caballi]